MGGRARRSIRDELLSVPGVAGAKFEGDPVVPEGVRVQLAPGADADDVGREVRRVLAGHGMRSQLTAPAVAPLRSTPPPEPRTVVNLAEFERGPAVGAGGTTPNAAGMPVRDEPASREPAADEPKIAVPESPAAAAPALQDVSTGDPETKDIS